MVRLGTCLGIKNPSSVCGGWLARDVRLLEGRSSKTELRLKLNVRPALHVTQIQVGPPAGMCVLASGVLVLVMDPAGSRERTN